jgi:hypothetical protein
MRTHYLCLGLVLAGLASGSGGCLAVVAGAGAAGTVAYMRGDLEADEPHNLDAVYDATRAAMDTLQLSVLEGKTDKDALSATVAARDAEDKRVTVRLRAQTEQTTSISIRIGTFGNQTKANLIYNRIRENLRAAAGAAPPSPPHPATSPPAPAAPAQATPMAPGSPPPEQPLPSSAASPTPPAAANPPAAP